MSKNNIEKRITYPVRKPKATPPKTKRIIKLKKGGTPEEEKPTNVVPFPIKPGTPLDQW